MSKVEECSPRCAAAVIVAPTSYSGLISSAMVAVLILVLVGDVGDVGCRERTKIQDRDQAVEEERRSSHVRLLREDGSVWVYSVPELVRP